MRYDAFFKSLGFKGLSTTVETLVATATRRSGIVCPSYKTRYHAHIMGKYRDS